MFEKVGFSNAIIQEKKVVYRNKWSKLIKTSFTHLGCDKAIYTTDFGNRSSVILLKKESILLVKQFRLLIDDYSWEIPGGKVEESETFEDAAIRECIEETGYKCNRLQEAIFFHPGLDTLHNPTKVFHCSDFHESKSFEDKNHETVAIEWFTKEKLKRLLNDNFFKDSLTIIALQNLFLK